MKRTAFILSAAAIIAAGGYFWTSNQPTSMTADAKVRLAIDTQATVGMLAVLADQEAIWQAEGIQPEIQRVATGRDAVQALLGGKVDVCTMADFPFALAAHQNDEIQIIAVIAQSSKHIQILGDGKLGVHALADLKGKKVGVTLGSAGQYALDQALVGAGLSAKDCELVSMTPPELIAAASRRELAAICTWQPHIEKIRALWAGDATPLESAQPYRMSFCVAAKKSFLKDSNTSVTKLIAGLSKAAKRAATAPADARAAFAKASGIDIGTLEKTWGDYDFSLSLPDDLLSTLKAQGQWAQQSGVLKQGTASPDWQARIATGFLPTIKP